MALLNFRRHAEPEVADLSGLVGEASIEVMPRTAAKVEDFRSILPRGTRVYIAHIDGTEFADMLATARRLAADGFDVMPHLPARSIPDRATLADWLARYQGEAGVRSALVLAGGRADPLGEFASSMQLLETGLFDKFHRIHVAGHPEGNHDIDPDRTSRIADEALAWKQRWAEERGILMAIATQFAFEPQPVTEWIDRLRHAGIELPVHVGVAGPAKLQTLIKYALACGVGPSLRVLQRRAMDLRKLVLPYRSDDLLCALQSWRLQNPKAGLEQIHVFPLGGIVPAAQWLADLRRGVAAAP